MPAALTYPGVYIEEIPSGVRTITGVATSITAFVGRAKRGPVNDPKMVNNFGDFGRIFGGLWLKSNMSYAVRDFYLNGGSRAIIVRLYHPYFETKEDRDKALNAANEVATAADKAADKVAKDGANPVEKAASDKAKEYTNDPEKTAAQAVAKAAADEAKKEIATAESVKTVASDKANEYTDDPEKTAAQAVAKAAEDAADKVAKAGANPVGKVASDKANEYTDDPEKTAAQVVAKAAKQAASKSDATAFTVANAANKAIGLAAPITKAHLKVGEFSLEAANEGAWGNHLRVRVDDDVSKDLANEFGLEKDDLFNLTIRDMKTGDTEEFRNLTVKESPRQVDQVLKNRSDLVRVEGELLDIPPSPHDKPTPGKDVWEDDKTSTGVDEQASDGVNLEDLDFIVSNTEDSKTGLYALQKVDIFNLLCIPPYKIDGNVDSSLIGEAATYCEKRRAMLLIDPPSGWSSKAIAKQDFIANGVGTTSKNSVLFFPRLKQPNPLRDNQMEEFAPCGAVAGVFARTDTQRGVWKAPAGLDATLVGVPQLSVPLTDPENGELNPLGVNCLRAMPAANRVIWGSRTLQGNDRLASEWKYIPVRRVALYIEESLYRGTQCVVFEPNDEPLWSQIRLNVGAFMHTLFRQGAFQGTTPKDAYFVKCDKETTTQNDIDRGIVNILVGFAPLKPAEFVVIKIQQIAGQIQT